MKNRLISEIQDLLHEKGHITVAIDGRCGAGKTTLAAYLREKLGCNVISADDFFLRPEQRSAERLSQAGGNIDYERLESEVLLPLSRSEEFSYRPYNCHTQSLEESVSVGKNSINIIEGSYSLHPRLRKYYDLKVFLDIDPRTQLERIERRNGRETLSVFKEKWIPLEEKYFEECDVKGQCDLVFCIKEEL